MASPKSNAAPPITPSFYVTAVLFKHINQAVKTHIDSVDSSFREFQHSVPIPSTEYKDVIEKYLRALQESSSALFLSISSAEKASILGPLTKDSNGKANETNSPVKSEHTPECASSPIAIMTVVPDKAQAVQRAAAPVAASKPAPIATPTAAPIAAPIGSRVSTPSFTPVLAHPVDPEVTAAIASDNTPIAPVTPRNAINGHQAQVLKSTTTDSAPKHLSRFMTTGKPAAGLTLAKATESPALHPTTPATTAGGTVKETQPSEGVDKRLNGTKCPPNKKIKTKEAVNTEVESSGLGPDALTAQDQTAGQANPQPANDMKRKRPTITEAESSTTIKPKAKPVTANSAAGPATQDDTITTRPFKTARKPRAKKTDEEKAATLKRQKEMRAQKAREAREAREVAKTADTTGMPAEKKTPTKKQLDRARTTLAAAQLAAANDKQAADNAEGVNDLAADSYLVDDASNDELEDVAA
ncbi:MAG: hypothetical protein M1829_001451 [Trizodia sp. TS-e1964]|nr:MAG: hypothetical protein M1829_001451 [Trizodia sp. TS-e1964]